MRIVPAWSGLVAVDSGSGPPALRTSTKPRRSLRAPSAAGLGGVGSTAEQDIPIRPLDSGRIASALATQVNVGGCGWRMGLPRGRGRAGHQPVVQSHDVTAEITPSG